MCNLKTGSIYQQIVGIPIGTNCAPLHCRFVLILLREGFLSNLHKSKKLGLVDKFNENSRYLDDELTIDKPEFEQHISDITVSQEPKCAKFGRAFTCSPIV